MWDPYAEFQSAVLPNGLTVHVAHWAGRPWESMGFLVHSGAEQDPIGLEGTAHFVEHLISENAGVPKKETDDFFMSHGGRVNLGATSWHQTCYKFWMPTTPAVFAQSLSIFGTALLSAQLEKCVERERQVITAEFFRSFQHKFGYELLVHERRAIYGSKHWLGRSFSLLGYPESISKISGDDLQSYYDAHYTPANMSIVCVGGLTLDQVVRFLSESPFAVSKRGERTKLPTPATDIAPPTENRHVVVISDHLKTENALQTGGYRSVAVIPTGGATFAVKILSQMLDVLLTDELREKRGLTYSVGSSFYWHRHFYEFVVECGSFASSAIGDVESIVEGCITSVQGNSELFERKKRDAIAAASMTDLHGRELCESALNELGKFQRINSLAEDIREIEVLTIDNIHSLLGWMKPELRWTRIVTP